MKTAMVTDIPEIVRLGRTAEEDSSLSVFWTASGIEMCVKTGNLFVEVESAYGTLELWMDIMIDGELSQRIQLPRGKSRIPVLQGLEAKKRTVRILRDTQAMAQDAVSVLRLRTLEFDEDAVFEKPAEPEYLLEFIGDSITSGEGAGLEKQEDWVPAVFSAVNSYGYLTAELLKGRANILSSSGWGLYASWDANTECVLPPYYREVCGLDQGEQNAAAGAQRPWDFSSYRPDVIVINLGTNDSGAINNNDRWTKEEYRPLFNKAAVDFLKTLRELNPESYLLWVYGLLGNDMADCICESIRTYREFSGDERVSYFEFANCDQAHLGVRYHPNCLAHREAAEVLAGTIRKLTGRKL